MKKIPFYFSILFFIFLVGCEPLNPYALEDFISVLVNEEVTIDVLMNDENVLNANEKKVTISTSPSNGMAHVNDDYTITYTPNDDFVGEDSFVYTLETTGDGYGEDTTSALVTIQVKEENVAPNAQDDYISVQINKYQYFTPLINDEDTDDEYLYILSIGKPNHGEVALYRGRDIEYVPNKDFKGEDQFTYTITDGIDTHQATIYLNVKDNIKPVANDDTYTINNAGDSEKVIFDVLGNDYDSDGDRIRLNSVSGASHGEVYMYEGKITYIPNKEYIGNDEFKYEIFDGVDFDEATVYVEVKEKNE